MSYEHSMYISHIRIYAYYGYVAGGLCNIRSAFLIKRYSHVNIMSYEHSIYISHIRIYAYYVYVTGGLCNIRSAFLLCFDLRPGPKKCYSKVIHRKEVTHSNGQ